MPQATEPGKPAPVVQELQVFPAILSYLIPGLGQIYQGRVGKGILFFSCVYLLFFYGQALGEWKNVYIVHVPKDPNSSWPQPVVNLYNRPQYLGQFWVGIAAWPAIWQYNRENHNPDPVLDQELTLNTLQREPAEQTLNELQIKGNKNWDLAWVYTVIAGVLNVLIIYDALAGPALAPAKDKEPAKPKEAAA